jgi:polysaccharide export outer membrane protein
MDRDGNNDDPPERETLSLAEFLSQGTVQLGDRAVLVVAEAGGGQQVYPLNRNPTVIGRSNNADLMLPDPTVSDFHARVIKHSFGYTLEDMGSAEGTFLRDKRVNHARLISGDTVRLGATLLTFLDERSNALKDKVATSLAPMRTTTIGLGPGQTIMRDPYSYSPHSYSPQLRSLPAPMPLRDSGERARRLAESEEGPSLEDVLVKVLRIVRYLRQRAKLIGVMTGIGLMLGIVSFKLFPPVRAAYCLVTLHPAPKANPIDSESRLVAQTESLQFFAGAERAFKSNESIMAAMKRLGDPNPSENQAEAIGKRLRFENIGNDTYTAELTPSIFNSRGDWHVRLLDAHIKNYIETEIEKKLKVFVAEVDFLRAQTEQTEKKLSEIMQETVKFREANSDQILAQGTLSGNSPADLDSRRIEVSARIDRLTGEVAGIRSQLGRGSALNQAKAQSATADREALGTLNRKLAELRAQGFADGHPDVERLLTEQKALQRTLDEHLHADVTQFERRSNVAYDGLQSQADLLEAQLRAARAERGTLEASLRDLRTVSSKSPKVNARLEELLRMKDEVEKQHALLFDRLKKAEVQLQLERVSTTSRYEIVIPARLETAPGRKAFFLRVLLGLGLGLVLAVLFMGISELRQVFIRIAPKAAAASLLLLLVTLPLGCAHDDRFLWAADLPASESASEPAVHPRDSILLEVEKQPTLSGEFVVREDGHYTQPMVGSIRVAGLTPRKIAAEVTAALKGVVITPVVSVWITKVAPIRVSVVGEVKTPGTYEMTRDRSLLTVLAQAGWISEFAHSDRVYVVRAGTNERIRFRVREISAADPVAAHFVLGDSDVVVVE